jgi:hypothetical protein
MKPMIIWCSWYQCVPHITRMVVAIRYVLVFLLLYFFRGSLYILSLLYMYIYESLTLK